MQTAAPFHAWNRASDASDATFHSRNDSFGPWNVMSRASDKPSDRWNETSDASDKAFDVWNTTFLPWNTAFRAGNPAGPHQQRRDEQ